ncbi:hypothetical protein T07_4810 [Trichinella nelsoni]|uniref:Uncharacterized protein n=1 Tax=Trichinella nelsoni TaxID=6336 RepID=A0A0V0RCI7_9BILA|nr:hypothetical protein T07_4810 [Trichinella nelsoni]
MKQPSKRYRPLMLWHADETHSANQTSRRMPYQQDENKAPKTNEGNSAAMGSKQAPLVKKEKNRK